MLMYYQISQPTDVTEGTVIQNFNYPFFAISPSLNILLTLMIVARLILHRRNIQNAMGASARTTAGLYQAIVTVLIESCALYAVSFILFIGPWGSGSSAANIFFPIVAQTQVCAFFLSLFHILQTYRNLISPLPMSRSSHHSLSSTELQTRRH